MSFSKNASKRGGVGRAGAKMVKAFMRLQNNMAAAAMEKAKTIARRERQVMAGRQVKRISEESNRSSR
jgi:hypothetical protein